MCGLSNEATTTTDYARAVNERCREDAASGMDSDGDRGVTRASARQPAQLAAFDVSAQDGLR